MRKAIILSFGILLCACVCFGQAGYIGLFEDAAYTDCYFDDTSSGLKHVYVVHTWTAGATASQWMLVNNGLLCTYLAESSPFITIGSAFSGISVAYGACLASDILLLDISYFCQGLTPPMCAAISVIPDPAAPTGQIEIVDCAANKLLTIGAPLHVNDDNSCGSCISPTEKTNWGQLKALYR